MIFRLVRRAGQLAFCETVTVTLGLFLLPFGRPPLDLRAANAAKLAARRFSLVVYARIF